MNMVNTSSNGSSYRKICLAGKAHSAKNDSNIYLFLVILVFELIVFALHFEVETFEFKVFFLLLALVTGFAMVVFAVEGLLQHRRLNKSLRQIE